MYDKKLKFAFVSNSMEIAELLKAFIDPGQEELVIHQASMEDSLPVARNLLNDGIEVIIGGGATGKLLRQSLNHPVVCITRTSTDIIRALIKAKNHGTHIGLNSYATPESGVDIFEKLLNIRIQQLVFTSTKGLLESLSKAKKSGVQCIVGSAIASKIASSMGLESVVIYPEKKDILHALEDARTLASAQRKQRNRSERFRIVLEAISEGVIGIDDKGVVNVCNDLAADYFNLNPANVLGSPLPDVLKGTGIIQVLKSGVPDVDQIRRVASIDMVVNTLPIVINDRIEAAISSFKPLSRIKNIGHKIKKDHLEKGFVAIYTFEHIKGNSSAMHSLRKKAEKYADTEASIMIVGETGTGKEILAQSIHNASGRKKNPFVAVNCSALPESLLESELFGYEEGAFTGAKKGGKMGLFEIANQGTIFLDEIADIPKSLQLRLLRVLEEKQVMRIGGDRLIPVDVRILSSSNRDISPGSEDVDFRSDLYFRLAVLSLKVPPLRDRLDDLNVIISQLLHKHGITKRIFSKSMVERLKKYSWPGNIRELDSLLWRYSILLEGLRPDKDLFDSLLQEVMDNNPEKNRLSSSLMNHPIENNTSLKEQVKNFENKVIEKTLAIHHYNRSKTAESLAISINTLWRKSRHIP